MCALCGLKSSSVARIVLPVYVCVLHGGVSELLLNPATAFNRHHVHNLSQNACRASPCVSLSLESFPLSEAYAVVLATVYNAAF